MSGSGSTNNVVLRPWPAAKKEHMTSFDLSSQINQLTSERGYLRNVTEKSLQDEIDTGKDVAEDVMEGVEAVDKKATPTREERQKELALARHEMAQKVDFALFSASNILDLVGLILSKDRTKNVDASFSAMFKAQGIPRGSFGVNRTVDRVKQHYEILRDEYDEERRKLAARGSRMQSLEWATDSILKAATQLETEVRKEVKYWDEILSISKKGWPLQRYRKGARHSPFAVRYGFPEASDHFRARGLAPLRMDKEGGIILDPALALQPKTLRVRISDGDQIAGTSHLAVDGDGTDLAIEKSIQLARDSLFEEEIFHELTMEARQLRAYGAELRNSVVQLTVPGTGKESSHRKILIDCIARDEDISGSDNHSRDQLAQNAAESLRLLLTHEHRMRLFRRSQIPSPLSQHKRQVHTPPLLRTLLAIFSHLNAVGSLQNYLDQTARTLRSAGLNAVLQISIETSWEKLTKIISESTRKDLSATDELLELFIKPFDGLAKLTLPSSNGTESDMLAIATRTYIGPPTFGSEYKVTLPPPLASVLNLAQDQKRDFKFSSADEVKSYVDWVLSLDLSHSLLGKEYMKKAITRSKDPRITISVKDGKKFMKKDVAVQLADGQLAVTVAPAPLLVGAASVQTYTWNGATQETSFKEKVKSLVG